MSIDIPARSSETAATPSTDATVNPTRFEPPTISERLSIHRLDSADHPLLTEAQNLATRLVGTTENGLRETIESGGAVIIAVRNGEVVGTTTAYLVDTADAELLAAVLPELAGQRLGQVEDVAVDYSARGHGLASAMVAEATEWLNDRDDVDCIVIASWEHQGPNAHNIYRRLDYREVATVEDFWNKTSDPEHPAESSCPECGPTCGCTAIVFVMP